MAKKKWMFLTIVLLFAQTLSCNADGVNSGPYAARDFSYLIGMKGFSDKMLKLHFSLYAGYVKNTNSLLSDIPKSDGYVYGALKRRLGWEMDGMRLHEYYFENLGGKDPLSSASKVYRAIEKEFGSYTAWLSDFKATGLIRGIGWVILYQDRQTGHLYNLWVNEHDLGHLSNANPLLVMDVWEHAYMVDYGIDRGQYIDVFFQNVNWSIVENRFMEAKQ